MSSIYTALTSLVRLVRQIVGPAIGLFVVVYFVYHTLHGERGFAALSRLQAETAQAQTVLDELRAKRMELERQARLLRPDNLDLDMLEERARIVLNQTHPDDQVILLPRRADPQSAQGKPGNTP
jgi:cell division protein FtsB